MPACLRARRRHDARLHRGGDGWPGQARPAGDRPRACAHACLHAGGDSGGGQGPHGRCGAGERRRDGARQRLSPDDPARRRAHRAPRRPAQVHELAGAHPHRFGRLPGDVARPAPHRPGGRRGVPRAYRRLASPSDPGGRRGGSASAGQRHHHGAGRMHALAGERRRGREGHAPLDALGCALQGSVRAAPGLWALRHRAGRRLSGVAGGIGGSADGDRLRWLCRGRACGGRGPGAHAGRARRAGRRAAGGAAALPDGGGHAGRHRAGRPPRDRPLRLRAAHPLRPHRACLYRARHSQHAQRPPRRGLIAGRCRLRLPDVRGL